MRTIMVISGPVDCEVEGDEVKDGVVVIVEGSEAEGVLLAVWSVVAVKASFLVTAPPLDAPVLLSWYETCGAYCHACWLLFVVVVTVLGWLTA